MASLEPGTVATGSNGIYWCTFLKVWGMIVQMSLIVMSYVASGS